jgi:hypothetical protein
MVHSSVRVKPNIRFLLILVVLAVASVLFTGCSGSPAATRQPAETRQAGTSITKPSPPAAPLVCPAFGASVALAPIQGKGGHRVILSWKGSAPADSKHAAAIGYCIYRSTGRKDSPPQMVNSVPFAGITCTDDFVENGSKYYYVVRAVSAKGVSSIRSNMAPARIPNSSSQSSAAISAPLCREPVAGK